MTRPGTPQVVRTGQPAAAAPQAQIMMLEADKSLCGELLAAGFPQSAVLEIAESFADKLRYLHEIESYKAQNGDLLKANQALLARAEEAENELRRTKRELKERERDAETGRLPG